ncbi:hypothetical protein [Niallia sp. 01092]|uniref:hypothetical protein n=1 Tax=unclassified Niallia TaxID=2837522 RepID=UPI003FD04562
MRKKIWIVLFVVFILIGSLIAYIKFKEKSVEGSVINYLTTEKNISKKDIISSGSFIANLSGNKNFMVGIKLKNDDKTYFYYKGNGKIILESYTENGVEHVENKQM